MVGDLIASHKEDFEKALDFFQEELGKLRTGRANPSLVEDISVDYYGTKSPIKQVASITLGDPRTLVISPWSRDSLVSIEKAIRESQLNLNPMNDGQVVRISIPALTEERRKDLVKILNQKAEEARIAVRRIRETIWEEIQSAEKSGKIGEDDKFSGKEKLQKTVDEFNGKVEEIREKKEKEIMTI